jgi:hypothetical protein
MGGNLLLVFEASVCLLEAKAYKRQNRNDGKAKGIVLEVKMLFFT